MDIKDTDSYFSVSDGRVTDVVITLDGQEIYRYVFDKEEGDLDA